MKLLLYAESLNGSAPMETALTAGPVKYDSYSSLEYWCGAQNLIEFLFIGQKMIELER